MEQGMGDEMGMSDVIRSALMEELILLKRELSKLQAELSAIKRELMKEPVRVYPDDYL